MVYNGLFTEYQRRRHLLQGFFPVLGDIVPCLITDQHEVEAVERLGRKVFLS